jgi:hypothetical protein
MALDPGEVCAAAGASGAARRAAASMAAADTGATRRRLRLLTFSLPADLFCSFPEA